MNSSLRLLPHLVSLSCLYVFSVAFICSKLSTIGISWQARAEPDPALSLFDGLIWLPCSPAKHLASVANVNNERRNRVEREAGGGAGQRGWREAEEGGAGGQKHKARAPVLKYMRLLTHAPYDTAGWNQFVVATAAASKCTLSNYFLLFETHLLLKNTATLQDDGLSSPGLFLSAKREQWKRLLLYWSGVARGM